MRREQRAALLAVFFGGGGDEEKFKKMPRECRRKREGELIVPSRVYHTFFAQTKPPATVYTGYFNRCGRKKKKTHGRQIQFAVDK